MKLTELAECIVAQIGLPVPDTFEEAIKSSNSKEWLIAMNNEMNSLQQNQTWELVSKS